jgi:hypothetical protein
MGAGRRRRRRRRRRRKGGGGERDREMRVVKERAVKER